MFDDIPNTPLLSDEETGALLEAMREEERARTPEARNADLASNEGPLRGALGRADAASPAIARAGRMELLRLIGRGIEVVAVPSEIVPGQVFEAAVDPRAIGYTLTSGGEPAGRIVVEPRLATFLIEHRMGGAAAGAERPIRSHFTGLDRTLVDPLPQSLCRAVSEHLLEGRRLKATPDGENAPPREGGLEPLLRLGVRFVDRDGDLGEATIALTAGALGTAPKIDDIVRSRGAIREHLAGVEIEVVGKLGEIPSSVRSLLGLDHGTILRLDRAPGDPVAICVDDVVVALGEPVVHKGDLAIRITAVGRHGGTDMSDAISDPVQDAPPGVGLDGRGREGDLDRILDIPLAVHVELGRRRMRISELLELEVGSVLELGTAAGAPLSVFANRVLVAHGEAVIVGERYGVRITDIVPAGERVRRLGTSEAA